MQQYCLIYLHAVALLGSPGSNLNLTPPHHNRFMALFPGPPR